MARRWWVWLLLGALIGGWVGYEIGRPSWLRAAQQLATGQRAPGIVEAVAVAAAGVGERWDSWRLQAAQRQAQAYQAELTIARATEAELRAQVGRLERDRQALQRAARDSAARQVAEVIDGVSERAALYTNECRDWGLQPVCPAVLRLRELERRQLSTAGSADRGGAGGASDPGRADRRAAATGELPRQRQRGDRAVQSPAGDAAAAGQPGPGLTEDAAR